MTMSSVLYECKKICFYRCLSAVALSIGTQYLLLIVFLLFVNFHIFHPLRWISETLSLMFSFYTWISIIPLISSVIIYGILLGKSQLAVRHYYCTRFKWLVGTSLRKLLFLGAHLLVGFLTALTYIRYLHVDYRNLLYQCYGVDCLNCYYIFLVCGGICIGCYHFIKENLREEPKIEFPIIQEKKFVKTRSLFYSTLYKSLLQAFVPTICYAFGFWLLSGFVNQHLSRLLNVEIDERVSMSFLGIATNVRLLFYGWILASQILSNMYLMQHFFSTLLSEEMHFVIGRNPLLAENSTEVTLVDALSISQVPLIQNLAALDLYNISISRSPNKRQEIFSLSLPGGHPYNWNQLSGQCLCMVNAFTEELIASVKSVSTTERFPYFDTASSTATEAAEKILLRQYNEIFGVRHLVAEPQTISMTSPGSTSPKSPFTVVQRFNEQFEHLLRQIEESLRTAFRKIPGVLYTFGELDGAKTTHLLSNSETILLLIQALAGICAASLVEDKYGVVQEVLPQIIKTFLRLKYELEKLNTMNLNGKRFDRNLFVLKQAVKRSLYNICTAFGDYLGDLIDEPQELRVLQCISNYQDV